MAPCARKAYGESLGWSPGSTQGWQSRPRACCLRGKQDFPDLLLGLLNPSLVMSRVTAEAGLLDHANQVKFLKGSTDTLPSPSPVQPLCHLTWALSTSSLSLDLASESWSLSPHSDPHETRCRVNLTPAQLWAHCSPLETP